MFANSWITLSLIQNVVNVLAIFTFVSGTLGITIGMCGPMNNPVTLYCRMHYLQLPTRRTVEIWQNFFLPMILMLVAVRAYQCHWNLFGFFVSLICLLWILRSALLNRFPERGYVHRKFELKFDLDWLKSSEQ
jgi:hypothetical protein